MNLTIFHNPADFDFENANLCLLGLLLNNQ